MPQPSRSSSLTDPRLPWPFALSGVVARVALFFSTRFAGGERQYAASLVLAAVLLPSAFVRARLPGNRVFVWMVRITVWAVMIAFGPTRRATGFSIVFEPDYVHLFGALCGTELVLRSWTRAASPRGPSRGEALLLAALIFMSASNTWTSVHMQTLVPVYTVLTILCLRSFGPAKRTTRAPLVTLRVSAVALAILVGFTSVFAVNRYEQKIMSWAVDAFRRERKRDKAEIGFGTAPPRLSAVFNPQPSMRRVMLVEGTHGTSERHMRMIAFDTYADRQWRPVLRERGFAPLAVSHQDEGEHVRITPLVDGMELVALPVETLAIETDETLEQDALGTIRVQGADVQSPYGLVVATTADSGGQVLGALDDAHRSAALAVPSDVDPKVLELARRVAGDGDASSRVARIELHLRSNHAYSLRYEPAAGAEPLSDFILNGRAAHCQYFASAAVVMCRAAGVPARLVTGYYAHEKYGAHATVVRDRDAHAWAECWIDGKGWVTVDATPAAARPDQAFPEASGVRRFWERVQDLPRLAREWLSSLRPRTIVLIIAAPIAAVALVSAVRYLRNRKRQSVVTARTYIQPSAELQFVAREFERWLRRRGVPCAGHVTWREHVNSVAKRAGTPSPIDLTLVVRFIDAYDAARFGGVNGQTMSRILELASSLEG